MEDDELTKIWKRKAGLRYKRQMRSSSLVLPRKRRKTENSREFLVVDKTLTKRPYQSSKNKSIRSQWFSPSFTLYIWKIQHIFSICHLIMDLFMTGHEKELSWKRLLFIGGELRVLVNAFCLIQEFLEQIWTNGKYTWSSRKCTTFSTPGTFSKAS